MDSDFLPDCVFPTPFGWVCISRSDNSDALGAFQQDVRALSSACATARPPGAVSNDDAAQCDQPTSVA